MRTVHERPVYEATIRVIKTGNHYMKAAFDMGRHGQPAAAWVIAEGGAYLRAYKSGAKQGGHVVQLPDHLLSEAERKRAAKRSGSAGADIIHRKDVERLQALQAEQLRAQFAKMGIPCTPETIRAAMRQTWG